MKKSGFDKCMLPKDRLFASLAAAAMLALASTQALAQSYPTRPVRIITPYSTGIAPDITARIVAEKLSRQWNQQVNVEPRPGANGMIAINAGRKSPADGHEILVLGNAHLTVNPVLFKDWSIDALAEFTPVNLVYRAGYIIAVGTNAPYKSMRDLIAAAKQGADKISYSSAYVGSPQHFGGGQLGYMVGAQMLAVHFKETGQMMSAVANGDTNFVIATIGSTGALVKAGKMRILATVSPRRLDTHPEVPTVAESGGPTGFHVDTWMSMAVPRATPAAIVSQLGADLGRVLADPEVIAKFRSFGVEPETASPARIAEMTRVELKLNADLVQKIGIKPE
ncbi:MAG: Bug family tripartite tricarboxylate transporter substrate binding protein [Burkholderiales bacterium]